MFVLKMGLLGLGHLVIFLAVSRFSFYPKGPDQDSGISEGLFSTPKSNP